MFGIAITPGLFIVPIAAMIWKRNSLIPPEN